MRVRMLGRDEWELWRRLRLDALDCDPDAFCESLDEMAGRADRYWRDIVLTTVDHARGYLAVAEVGGEPSGTVFARLSEDYEVVHVGAMWVAPSARGSGIGAELLGAAIAWGRDGGASRAELWVTAGNTDAERVYRRSGFVPTGATGRLRDGSSLHILEMAKSLAGGG